MTKLSLTVKADDITSSRRDMNLGTGGYGLFRGERVKGILEVHCGTYNATAALVDTECNNYRAVIKSRGPGISPSYYEHDPNRTKRYPWLFDSPPTCCIYPAT